MQKVFSSNRTKNYTHKSIQMWWAGSDWQMLVTWEIPFDLLTLVREIVFFSPFFLCQTYLGNTTMRLKWDNFLSREISTEPLNSNLIDKFCFVLLPLKSIVGRMVGWMKARMESVQQNIYYWWWAGLDFLIGSRARNHKHTVYTHMVWWFEGEITLSRDSYSEWIFKVIFSEHVESLRG